MRSFEIDSFARRPAVLHRLKTIKAAQKKACMQLVIDWVTAEIRFLQPEIYASNAGMNIS